MKKKVWEIVAFCSFYQRHVNAFQFVWVGKLDFSACGRNFKGVVEKLAETVYIWLLLRWVSRHIFNKSSNGDFLWTIFGEIWWWCKKKGESGKMVWRRQLSAASAACWADRRQLPTTELALAVKPQLHFSSRRRRRRRLMGSKMKADICQNKNTL